MYCSEIRAPLNCFDEVPQYWCGGLQYFVSKKCEPNRTYAIVSNGSFGAVRTVKPLISSI